MSTPQLMKKVQSLIKKGELDNAQGLLSKALSKDPRNTDIMATLADTHMSQGRLSAAKEVMSKAVSCGDINPQHLFNLAEINYQLGDTNEAVIHLHKLIELSPAFGPAYYMLASIDSHYDIATLSKKVEIQLSNNGQGDNASFLHFSAGKMFDRLGEYDRAFTHFSMGNQYANVSYDPSASTTLAKNTLYRYGDNYHQERKNCGYANKEPIFIVGMSRSGTNLVERILSSHSGVYGAGEIDHIYRITLTMEESITPRAHYTDFIQYMPNQLVQNYSKAYHKEILRLAGGSEYQRIVNKKHDNFFYLGLIFDMFPHSRVINVVRDPRDSCLSSYFEKFRLGMQHSYDLEHIGKYYAIYHRMMEHWKHYGPDKICDIPYEDLIDSPEVTMRKILGHCGVEWQDNCLDFYKQGRFSRNGCAWHESRPLDNRTRGRWKNYSQQITPLLNQVQPYL